MSTHLRRTPARRWAPGSATCGMILPVTPGRVTHHPRHVDPDSSARPPGGDEGGPGGPRDHSPQATARPKGPWPSDPPVEAKTHPAGGRRPELTRNPYTAHRWASIVKRPAQGKTAPVFLIPRAKPQVSRNCAKFTGAGNRILHKTVLVGKTLGQSPRKPRPHGFARRRMTPTHRVEHALASCPECGTGLTGGWVQRTREVIDVPVVPAAVTEHVFIARTCPICQQRRTPQADLAGVVLGKQRWASTCSA